MYSDVSVSRFNALANMMGGVMRPELEVIGSSKEVSNSSVEEAGAISEIELIGPEKLRSGMEGDPDTGVVEMSGTLSTGGTEH